MNYCEGCFEKQRKIDALMEENQRLKAKLGYLERKEKEGYFGSSTPSSQAPVKANTLKEKQGKRGGAKPGHPGHGRHGFDESQADCVIRAPSEIGDRCPRCGGPLAQLPHSIKRNYEISIGYRFFSHYKALSHYFRC